MYCPEKVEPSALQDEENIVPTFVAVPDGVEVHVVLVVGEEEQAEPGVESIDGNDEEDPHDVTLLPGSTVETQVHVDLRKTGESF